MLSIIIPYHNEGQVFIDTTISQIRDTIDTPEYEIIVVDDGSDIKPVFSPSPGKAQGEVILLNHGVNKGVGAAFDTGVAAARHENLILMGCDIRFIANGWASKMIEEIKAHQKSFICSACVSLNALVPENLDINKRRLVQVTYGATILMFHDKKSNPKKEESFRGIIEAKWMPGRLGKNGESYEVPCILGAFYGVKKEWYNYVDGWAGHKLWGTLEPYISLKSWLFGGSCRVAPSIETGHIFKPHGTHGTPQDALMYNKMFVAKVLLDDSERLINFLGNNSILQRSRSMFAENEKYILGKKQEYAGKKVLNELTFFKKFGIDYRINN